MHYILFCLFLWFCVLAPLWVAMLRDRTCWIDGGMNNLADFEVRFVIGEKLFPMREALQSAQGDADH